MLFTRLERKARLKLLLPLTGADPGRLEEPLLVHHLHRVLLETLNRRDSNTCHHMVHQAKHKLSKQPIVSCCSFFELPRMELNVDAYTACISGKFKSYTN